MSVIIICVIILFLMTHLVIYCTLQSKINVTVIIDKVSSLIIDISQAQKLLYLQTFIQKSTCIWLTVMRLLFKVTSLKEDMIELNDKMMFLLRNINIDYCVWGAHCNKDVVGKDAHMLWPKRWLVEQSEERLGCMQRTA